MIFEYVSRDTVKLFGIFVLALLFGILLSDKVPFKLELTFKPYPEFSLETIDNYTEKYSNMMERLTNEINVLRNQSDLITNLEKNISELEVKNSTMEEQMKGKDETVAHQNKQIARLNEQLKGCHENFNTIAGTMNLLDGRHETALICSETGDMECYNRVALKWELNSTVKSDDEAENKTEQ